MRNEKKIINLFQDKDISNIKHVMSIDTLDDLNQYWGFVANSNNAQYELIYTFLTQFYSFALEYIKLENKEFFEIIVEQTDKYCYFTIWNDNVSLHFKEHIKKTSLTFLHKNNKLSIRINKLKSQKHIDKINEKHEKRTKELIESVTKEIKPKPTEPYDFLEHEDLEDLLKLNDDMQELIFQSKIHSLNENIFIPLRSTVSLFCLTLRYYKKISPMATTITEFSNLLNVNNDRFTNLDSYELDLISGFIHNIDTWLESLFVKGGTNLYFMDNSMKADLDMISQIINPNDNLADEDLDNIFDF